MRRWLGLGALLTLFACSDGYSEYDQRPPPDYTGPSNGRFLIDWTIGGLPASADACSGVDHLVLALYSDDGRDITIEPIPCSLTRMRYDQLPDGPGTLRLDGIDAS